jgi:beta-glucosidase
MKSPLHPARFASVVDAVRFRTAAARSLVCAATRASANAHAKRLIRVSAVLALGLAVQSYPLEAATLPWMDTTLPAEQRTALLIAAMTLDQKFEQIVGAPGIVPELPQCFGARHVPGIPSLQIPTLRITNGPVGIGQNDCVPPNTPGLPFAAFSSPLSAKATALPSGMAIAASFDPVVASQFGDLIGTEARNLALHVLEGPGINMARVPEGGRNFEYFGEDPLLTGTMAVNEIRAIQSHGVIGMAKHMVGNEQETNRMTVNEFIDDRVLHELYLLPFEMSVKDGDTAAVMCSYPSVNGSFSCENKHILTDVLRGQWGFKGYVQSDFFAVHSTAPTLLAGMDHEMPGLPLPPPLDGPWFAPAKLTAALNANLITVADIDQALGRRYTQMFRLGIFDRPVAQTPIDAVGDGAIARSLGEQSAVLLKNANDLLPIDAKAVHSIALIGQADYATKAVAGCCGGSSDVIPLYTVTPLQGVQNVLAALGSSATANLTVVANDNSNLTTAVAAARAADVVIVLAGTISDEGQDLVTIALPNNQDTMISAVAAANPSTAVVLKDNASSLLPWIDQVPAVLEAWFPGQEDGNIVARLLFGLANPSGKLPVTFPKHANDTPITSPRQWPGVDAQGNPVPVRPPNNVPTTVEYSEGLQIGYRWYDAQGIQPLFPFGHGLSYTTFEISKLEVTPKVSDGTHPLLVQFFVTNTGSHYGAEVPQVYLGLPASLGEPPKRLVAFQKVWLNPGEKTKIKISIDPGATNHPLGYWDSTAQAWKIADGTYQVYVGNSAVNIVLNDSITVRTPPGHNR